MSGRNEETGQFSDIYSREAFLDAMPDRGEPISTSEVAERVGCAHDTAYKRLQELEAEDEVTSQKVGTVLLWAKARFRIGADEEEG